MAYPSTSSSAYEMDFDLGYNSAYDQTQWNDADASEFLFDSPQPESRSIAQEKNKTQQTYPPSSSHPPAPAHTQSASLEQSQSVQQQQNIPYTAGPPTTMFSMPSSASESSDHSSSSNSSAQRKRKSSLSSTPPDFLAQNSFMSTSLPSESIYQESKLYQGPTDNYNTYGGMNEQAFSNPAIGTLNADIMADDTSLMGFSSDNSPNFSHDTTLPQRNGIQHSGFSPMFQLNSASSPVMHLSQDIPVRSTKELQQMNTIQPSQTTLTLNHRDESPMMFGSNESSPGAYGNNGSPYSVNNDVLNSGFANSPLSLPNRSIKQEPNSDLKSDTTSSSAQPLKPSSQTTSFVEQWPYRMTIGKTPDKSRVETQIAINLNIVGLSHAITKIHLPAHTISKPKFQSKPPHQKSPDTAELSAMLVCASAMEREGLERKALERAAKDDIFVSEEEDQPAATKVQTDDSDPNRPLNGGPVSICSGCINRERKRAARKKTKKQEEEDEWAKDEAKRVIVFNCPEVKDWCVVGTKDEPVKDYDGKVEAVYVNAPMRVACYCRHQNEKTGFQIVFTLRNSDGQILAQNISHSIMITDDHKQPGAGQVDFEYNMMANAGMFQQGYPIMANYLRQPGIHRNSYSSNDLSGFANQAAHNYGNHYAPQRGPTTLSRQTSSGYSSAVPSTTSTTPRNLSRPASPTNDFEPSAKKRRAGSGHSKIPSGLAMTRMENNFSPTSAPQSAGPMSAGPTSGGFNFVAPHGFSCLGNAQPPTTADPYSSGPSTPLFAMGGMTANSAFANSAASDYAFYSAPTSQQHSRAASPASAVRRRQQQNSGFGHQYNQSLDQKQQVQPNELSAALSSIPNFDAQNPPIIHKIVPHYGHIRGGEEIIILGTGLVEGLEICFGDTVALPEKVWGDGSIFLHAPPATEEGQVAVVFRHQHPSLAKHNFREMVRRTGVMPTTQVLYTYLDDDRTQMRELEDAVRVQQLGR